MKNNGGEKFCGNCDSHDCYNYPTEIFCSNRHNNNKNPIVDALWHCNSWNKVSQKCYCVHEALKQKNNGEATQT